VVPSLINLFFNNVLARGLLVLVIHSIDMYVLPAFVDSRLLHPLTIVDAVSVYILV
jgi:hypothetical protein